MTEVAAAAQIAPAAVADSEKEEATTATVEARSKEEAEAANAAAAAEGTDVTEVGRISISRDWTRYVSQDASAEIARLREQLDELRQWKEAIFAAMAEAEEEKRQQTRDGLTAAATEKNKTGNNSVWTLLAADYKECSYGRDKLKWFPYARSQYQHRNQSISRILHSLSLD